MKKLFFFLFLYPSLCLSMDIEKGKQKLERRHSDGGLTISSEKQEDLSLLEKAYSLLPNSARPAEKKDDELCQVQNLACQAVFGMVSEAVPNGHIQKFRNDLALLKDSPKDEDKKKYKTLLQLSNNQSEHESSSHDSALEEQDEVRKLVNDLVQKSLKAHFTEQEKQVKNAKIWSGLTISFAVIMAIPAILQLAAGIIVPVSCDQ